MEKFFLFAIPVLISVLGLAQITISTVLERQKKNARNELHELIKNSDPVPGLEHLRLLKSAIDRKHSVELSLVEVLEDHLVRLRESKEAEDSVEGDLQRRFDRIAELISEESTEQPFDKLPEEERRLLRSARDGLAHDDRNAVEFNLNELCSVLSIRSKEFSRVSQRNRWAVPLAVFGLLFTLIFGVLGLVHPSERIDASAELQQIRGELRELQWVLLSQRSDGRGASAPSGKPTREEPANQALAPDGRSHR